MLNVAAGNLDKTGNMTNPEQTPESLQHVCPILGRVTKTFPTPFSSGPWQVVRCSETGFVFLANPPTYQQLEVEHAWEVTSLAEKKRRRLEEPLVSKMSLLAAKLKQTLFPKRSRFFTLSMELADRTNRSEPIRVLDIGCGAGNLLEEMQQRFTEKGYSIIPQGIEVSAHLAAIANQRCEKFGGRVAFANAVDGVSQFEKASVDLVIMSSFLEHECQPLVLLRKLHSVLANAGIIVLKVPNFACINRRFRSKKWCGFRYPDHVSYFTPSTLRRLAQESGFQVSRQGILDCLPLSDTMYAVLAKDPKSFASEPEQLISTPPLKDAA